MAAKFIGLDALESIAVKYTEEIVMGGMYFRPDIFTRLQIKVVTGLQYKDVARVMNRKGHTTRRKVVGDTLNSTLGYLEERPMVGHLAWNRYMDNRDNYVEEAVFSGDPDHSSEFSYPASEIAFKAAVANYGEDIYECLWHGDDEIEDKAPNAYLNLYTGFITYLNRDINKGRISTANGNLVKGTSFVAPADANDQLAWKAFVAFREKWSQNLKNAPKVLVYVTDEAGLALRDAYSNSKSNHKDVIDLENGNFRFPLWNNIEICPEASLGKGCKMIATTPQNFEYGVDTLNSQSKISVQVGSDKDTEDIFFQVQSIQGVRVRNVNASHFCMTDSPLIHVDNAGDYTKNSFVVTSNDESMGKVTINSESSDAKKEYATGTEITLKATAEASHKFVQWSNGMKEATITLVKKDCPEAMTAFFAHE